MQQPILSIYPSIHLTGNPLIIYNDSEIQIFIYIHLPTTLLSIFNVVVIVLQLYNADAV